MNGVVTSGRHTIVPDDIDCNVELELGSFCSIASGLTIISGQHPPVDAPMCVSTFPFAEHGWGDYPPSRMNGKVVVGHDVWIGQGVSILDGVEIGHGAIIGACSVVTRDVEPYSIVAGNPAGLRKWRFPPNTREALLALGWWNWSDKEIAEALPQMSHASDLLRSDRW